ncbi:MAG: response regulator [Nitrospinae bacterium]|nr:response regulator [Nitrospinota bacterium]
MITEEDILNGRILIVDDLDSNVKLLERSIESAGYGSFISTTDPIEVVDLYQSFEPDLLILDINMPEMDGFEVMKALKDISNDDYLPILVLTAQTDRETRIKALKAGAKDFITKPFDKVELLNRINNMLEVRLLHNQVKGQNTILEEKVRERTKELYDSRLDVIRRLGRAAEYRDNETGLHIVRMSKMCAVLGKAVGMDDAEVELLLEASPMHDVGKIGIPDNILLKPGKLTEEEFKVIMNHPEIGAEILADGNSDLMEMARTIALTHHEKWNGNGYPNGLKGEEIPLVGRIASICDVFDALTCIRPYKRSWTVGEAVSELEKCKGIQFDPELVDLFISKLTEMTTVMAKYHDEQKIDKET